MKKFIAFSYHYYNNFKLCSKDDEMFVDISKQEESKILKINERPNKSNIGSPDSSLYAYR